jgi:hypothetical protein
MIVLLINAARSLPSCPVNLSVTPNLGFWSGVLNGGDCVRLLINVPVSDYYAYIVLSASADILITRYYIREDGKTWDIAYEGITPTLPSVERIGAGAATFVFSPITNGTNFSLTYTDLTTLRCDRVTISNANDWRFSFNSSTIQPNKTCLLSGAAGNKTLKLRLGSCPNCEVFVYSDQILSFSENVYTDLSLGVNAVLVTIGPKTSGTPDVGALTLNLTSDAEPPAYNASIDLPTEGILLPRRPLPQLSGHSDVYLLIVLGFVSFVLQLLTGHVIFKECLKEPDDDATMAPAASPAGFTQAIRYVDNNIAD